MRGQTQQRLQRKLSKNRPQRRTKLQSENQEKIVTVMMVIRVVATVKLTQRIKRTITLERRKRRRRKNDESDRQVALEALVVGRRLHRVVAEVHLLLQIHPLTHLGIEWRAAKRRLTE